MVSEKLTSSNGRAMPRPVGSESREPAESSPVEVTRIEHKNLRPAFRTVFHSRKLLERLIKETAEEIGISVAAPKSRLFHAKITPRKSPTPKLKLSTFFQLRDV